MDAEAINNMLAKIVDGDNTGAKEDFETIISQKLNAALDAKKQEVAHSIYGQQVSNDAEEVADTDDVEGEEQDLETSSEQESEDAVQ